MIFWVGYFLGLLVGMCATFYLTRDTRAEVEKELKPLIEAIRARDTGGSQVAVNNAARDLADKYAPEEDNE